MARLTITRGLPGSGKTTWARDQRGHVRVNRDDLRRMLHGGLIGLGWAEVQVTIAQRAQIDALLRAGINVICDDTNLRSRVVRDLAELALAGGAEVTIKDFVEVPVDECVARDAARPPAEQVGEEVIRGMWRRHLAGRTLPLPIPALAVAPPAAAAYEPPAGQPEAFLVDIDGTVATLGPRDPYDETCVDQDQPNPPVVAVVRAIAATGYRIVYCSGRTDGCREATLAWLATHVGVEHEGLFMRASGDQRKDWLVKRELFDAHVRHRYRIIGVLDDRNQVVRMWRGLGLTVFQVADGDF
jgi:predicted kinase